ncbi:hypothetical protein GTY75_08925 [Streptomyces sp. SID8381]|uniref:hypothetical protein n=1 Tax=unclassified Streptomyces TaxID=2593676 RepID=UPI00036C745D|nr:MULTISPECIES: hypothetical protein [unclassified Streptomyces]MYX26790.1 hypothetical protein [Streptomyces sp. SID8381]
MIGALTLAVIAALLWLLVGIPWWISAWFLSTSLYAFIRLFERKQSKDESSTLTVTEVRETRVQIREFRF